MSLLFANHQPINKNVSMQLDSLRGLSALAVVFGHSFQVFIAPISSTLFPIFGLVAQGAVMMFFVLSGLLITKSITRNFNQQGGFWIGSYSINRVNRIYPPLLFAMVLVAALYVLVPYFFPSGSHVYQFTDSFIVRDGFSVNFVDWTGTLLFLNGFAVRNISANGPLWSLSFEVWYYVIAGLVAWKPKSGLLFSTTLILILGYANRPFAFYSLVWFGGAAIALLHNHNIRIKPYVTFAGAALLIVTLVTAAVYVGLARNAQSPSDYPSNLMVLFNVASGLTFAVGLYFIIFDTLSFKPLLASSAKYSYTLYVTHFPIFLVIYGIFQPSLFGRFVPSVLASIGAFVTALAFAAIIAPKLESAKLIDWKKLGVTV